MHPKVEVAGQPITTSSTSEAVQRATTAPMAQPFVSPIIPQQAAV